MRPGPPAVVPTLEALVGRARGGDPDALAALRRALADRPEVWVQFGDLAAHAERAWVALVAGPDLALAEALGRRLAALKAELAGPAPSPLERLLVERVAACWLQLHQADATIAQAKDAPLRLAEFAAWRQDRAHRRYLTALATVRRLLPCPAVDGEGSTETLPLGARIGLRAGVARPGGRARRARPRARSSAS